MRSKLFLLFMVVCITAVSLALMNTESTPLPDDAVIDKLLVEKSKRQMHALSKGEVVKTYKIALGGNPIGHKEYEGDLKTPEGVYTINDKNPNSAYHLNLGISFPNKEDRIRAAAMGKAPGGDIKIHGLRNGLGHIGKAHLLQDWTQGCIAVTNEEIGELFNAVPVGTTIEIIP